MAHRTIPKSVQLAIVRMLATYLTPSEVTLTVKEEFGIEVSRQNVGYYDATLNGDLPLDLKTVFFDERENFQTRLASLPIESRAHRQRRRLKLFNNCAKNPKMALAILDSAAKESGGHFTNKMESTVTKAQLLGRKPSGRPKRKSGSGIARRQATSPGLQAESHESDEFQFQAAIARAQKAMIGSTPPLEGKPAKVMGQNHFCLMGMVKDEYLHVWDIVGGTSTYREQTGERPSYKPIPLSRIHQLCQDLNQTFAFISDSD